MSDIAAAFRIVAGCVRLLVVDVRLRTKLCGLLLGRRVTQEITTSNLGPREIFQQIGPPQWWMYLDVKMKPLIAYSVGRGLVQRHDIGKRHLPKVVEHHKRLLQRFSKLRYLC